MMFKSLAIFVCSFQLQVAQLDIEQVRFEGQNYIVHNLGSRKNVYTEKGVYIFTVKKGYFWGCDCLNDRKNKSKIN